MWRNPDFLLLWGGQTVSTLGSRVSFLAFPLLVLAITHSPAQAGFIAATASAPYLVLSLPAGALVDRWNRRRVMVCCDVIRGLAFGSIPLAAGLGHLSMAQLYAVALVEGTAFVFFNIAQIACLPRVVPAAHLPRAYAANMVSEATSWLIGPGVGGFIISLARTTVAGAMLAYAVDSLSYLASVLSLLCIRTPCQPERQPRAPGTLRTEIADGLRFLWAQRRIRIIALQSMSLSLLYSSIYLAVVVLARDDLQANARTIGLIASVSSVGGVIGAVVAPRVQARLRLGHAIIGTVALQALVTPVLATASSSAMLMVGGAAMFGLFPVYNVTQTAYRLATLPDTMQGRVNSVFRLLAFSGQPVGMAAGGALLATLGPRVELWLIAAGLALSALAVGFTEVRHA